jgi:glucose/arabinose dehydrogenase
MVRFLCAFVLLTTITAATSWALPPGFTIQQVHGGLAFPTSLRFAPDGRLFYTELMSGRIMYFQNAFSTSPTTFAIVSAAGGGERGLLSIAFHPQFPDSPYVYVFHSNASPLVDRVARLTDMGGIGTNYTVIFDGLPSGNDNHHGGRLAFGPDGMLYVTVGDQENPSNAENSGSLNGKILRVTPMGRAAPGNPFGAGNPAYTLGMRNPFGICFDPQNGACYETEPGPECDCEVNYVEAGADYGWGPNDFCGGQPPGSHPAIHTFGSVVTPTGVCVYRGASYPGSLQGNLFFGSYNNSSLFRLKLRSGTLDQEDSLQTFATFAEPVLDVTVGIESSLWVATTSAIYRILPRATVGVGPNAPLATSFVASPNPFRDHLSFDLSGLPSGARLEILDLQGRVVRRWAAPLPAGLQWNGSAENGRPLVAGIYLARVIAPGYMATRRLIRVTR